MYKISEVVELTGLSARTLRYYEEIDLIKPLKNQNNGYRHYSEQDLDLLQSILLYRELDLPLEDIRKIITQPDFSIVTSLKVHLETLEMKKLKLQNLIQTVQKSIKYHQGETSMSEHDKFEAFKAQLIQKNEEKYGEELRATYSEEALKKSTQKVKNMRKEEYQEQQDRAEKIMKLLKIAFQENNPTSKEAKEACLLHQEWIRGWWGTYAKEAHLNLVQMYTVDDRFRKYYDAPCGDGAADFFYLAMKDYLKL